MLFIFLIVNGFALNAAEIQPKGIEKAANEGELEMEHKMAAVYIAIDLFLKTLRYE